MTHYSKGCSESQNSGKTPPKQIFLNMTKTKKVLAKHQQNSCFAIGPTEPQHDQNTFSKLSQNLAFPFFNSVDTLVTSNCTITWLIHLCPSFVILTDCPLLLHHQLGSWPKAREGLSQTSMLNPSSWSSVLVIHQQRLMPNLSQLATGCVTCHTCHGCVTDFRPILGNPMEVTHVTFLGHVYIFPH